MPEYEETLLHFQRSNYNKKFWEELIAYFPRRIKIRQGQHRKRRLQLFFVAETS
jgi:hypothetical protein